MGNSGMEIKRAGKDRRIQAAIMYLVMAFSFCIFLWLFATVEAPDVRFDSEAITEITGEWRIEYQGETGVSLLPGPFTPQKGIPIRYSITLGDYGIRGNSIMFRAVHQYVRLYLDGELIGESGYQQKTPFGDAPYNSWVIVRLPDGNQGKTLTIETTKYYNKLSGRVDTVYFGSKNSLVFHVIHECIPAMIFNFAVIFAAFLLLLFSFAYQRRYFTCQLRCLCIFSLVTCMWLVLESGGYQIFWGNAPLISNTLFLLFYLIPPACIRFIMTYKSFSEDRWLHLLYWLSIVNILVVSVLQIAGISDYIESLVGSHLILILMMADILIRFVIHTLRGELERDIQLVAASLSFAIFACLDIVRFYLNQSNTASAYFSQIGVTIFFMILICHAVRQLVQEREEHVRQELLEHMAYRDMLTDLPNRNAFEQRMTQLREENCSNILVMVADLNELKTINDSWGHQKGDEALVYVARALKRSFGESERLYRIGGDEFCILSDRIGAQEAEICYSKLMAALDNTEQELGFSVSVAVGWSAEDGSGIDTAFHNADFIMYKKKQQMKQGRKKKGCGGTTNETEYETNE